MTRKVFQPHPYQREILQHQLGLARGATFAGMGTGKTVSTLTAIDALQWDGMGPALVLAPKRVAASTWPDEAAKWEHLAGMEVQPILGEEATRRAALRNTNAGVFAINYDNIPWLRETLGKTRWPFAMVVADESTRLKKFRLRQGGVRAKAIGQVAHSAFVDRWQNLTGTPVPNGLSDLWGQTWMIDGGERLGHTFDAFDKRWFYSGYDKVKRPHDHAMQQIQDKIRDVCLTVQGLPVDVPIFNNILVDLPQRARALYKDMEATFYAMISATTEVEAFSAAAKSQKLLQLANGAVYTDDKGAWSETHTAKLDALESVIEEAAGASVLVAYHHRSDLTRLRRAHPKARVLDADPNTIRDWNAGKIPILLAHPASAGHGLNLQDGGNILCFFAIDWNLEHYAQIIERIGPMRQKQAGHNRPVFVHHILAKDTIDELVLERLTSKASVQETLLEAMRRRS